MTLCDEHQEDWKEAHASGCVRCYYAEDLIVAKSYLKTAEAKVERLETESIEWKDKTAHTMKEARLKIEGLKTSVGVLSSSLDCWERLGREIHNGMTGNSDIPARQTHDKLRILLSAVSKQITQQSPPVTEGDKGNNAK